MSNPKAHNNKYIYFFNSSACSPLVDKKNPAHCSQCIQQHFDRSVIPPEVNEKADGSRTGNEVVCL